MGMPFAQYDSVRKTWTAATSIRAGSVLIVTSPRRHSSLIARLPLSLDRLSERANASRDEKRRDEEERDDVRPQLREAGAPDDDPARDRDEVRRREDLGDDTKRRGERRDREDVAREHDRGEKEDLRELDRLDLRPRPRGDEEAHREEGEEVHEREAAEEEDVAVDRNAKERRHEEENEEELHEAEREVREELPDHDADGGDGGHHQLLERAALPLAHDREGGEERSGEREEDGEEPGDQEVRAPRVRVEDEERVDADGELAKPGPFPQLEEGAVQRKAVRRGEGRRGDARIGPVDENEEVGGPAVEPCARVVGRDLDSHGGARRDDRLVHLAPRRRVADDAEYSR